MRYGAIYIAHNPRNGDNTFKVGMTERSVDERMKELSAATSNLGTYSAAAFFIVTDIDSAEKACHKRLKKYRVQSNREFFELSFPRLLQIVKDEIEPYLARSLVPEMEEDPSVSTQERNVSGMLKSSREKKKGAESLWKDAWAKAEHTILEWFNPVRQRALKASKDLQSEDFLKWEIPHEIDPKHFEKEIRLKLCSVMVTCRFKKKPLVLWREEFILNSEIQSCKILKIIDTPRVIKNSTKRRKAFGTSETEIVSWKELDDGRIGRIDLYTFIDIYSKNEPFPTLEVIATPLRYDSYKENFKDSYPSSKSFNDPDEAFRVFLELIVINATNPQYDVREKNGFHDKNYEDKSPRPKILDMGQFEADLLE
jgi:hypothetical protein